MRAFNLGAVRRALYASAVLTLSSVPSLAQVVEKGRTFADLTASHPCDTGLTERIARVTDCDAADDVGDGEGLFQCWVRCDGTAPWETVAIGGGAGGTGDVVGPASSVDSEIVAFNSTTGKLVKASGIKMNSGFIVHSDDGTGGIFNSLSGQIAGWLINGNSNGYVSAYAAGSSGIVTISKRATNDFNLGLQATTGIYWVSSGNGADNSANADAGLDRLAPGVVVTTDGTESGLGWSYQDGKKALNADFTSTSATPANLTGLTVTLRTGRKYTFRMALRFSDSTAADGARFDFDGGTATATDFGVNCQVYDTALLLSQDTTALATDIAPTTTTGASSIKCDGSVTVNAAGTFIVRAGQEAASGGTLTVETGSYLHVTDTSFN